MKNFVTWVVLLCFTMPAYAEALRLAFKPGLDQEVLEVMPFASGASVLLIRKYLATRQGKSDAAREHRQQLEIDDPSAGRQAPVMEFDAQQTLIVGRPILTTEGHEFLVSSGTSRFELFRHQLSEHKALRVDISSLRAKINADGAFDRIFKVQDGLVVVRPDHGAQRASFYANADGASTRLETAIPGRDTRLIAIDDVMQFGGQLYLVASVATDGKEDISEVWLFTFDRTTGRPASAAMPLELDRIQSGRSRFISTEHGFPSIEVVSRVSRASPPVVTLFGVKTKPARVWSMSLPRPESVRDVATVGVCSASYVVARRLPGAQAGLGDIEYTLINAKGRASVLSRQQLVDNGTIVNLSVYADKGRVLTAANFSKLEDSRRPDGWYSWAGYRVDAMSTKSLCDR